MMAHRALSTLRCLYRPSDDGFLDSLTAAQRSVLAVLAMHTNETGTCYPSLPTITQASGFSRRMVIRTLGELEEMGHISRTVRPPRSTLYTVHVVHRAPDAPCTTDTVTVHPMHLHNAPHAPERPIERPIEEDMGDKSPDDGGERDFPPLSKLPRDGRRRIYPPEFEGAYQALPPRHRSHPKGAAYKAWRARVHDVEEVFQLEAAADAYREDCERRGKAGTEFVMQAARFFGSGGEWEPYSGIEPMPEGNGRPKRGPDALIMTGAELDEWDRQATGGSP